MPDDPLDVGMLEKWKSRVLDCAYRLLYFYAGIVLYVAFIRQTTLYSRKELDSKSVEKIYHKKFGSGRTVHSAKVQWQHKKGSECTWEPEDEMRIHYPELFVGTDFEVEVPS